MLIQTIRAGQKNLESLGVVSRKAKKIIRQVEGLGGAAKIIGGGGVKEGSGMLLVYHRRPQIIIDFATHNNLESFKIKLRQKGLKYG